MKLKHDKLLSNFAYNCNLRRYTKVEGAALSGAAAAQQVLDMLKAPAPLSAL